MPVSGLTKVAMDKLSMPVVEIYNAMEQEMLVNIASKLKGKVDLMEKDPEAWKLQQMNYLGMLDRENLNTVRKHAGITAAQLNKILYNALIVGMDTTDGAMEKAIKDGAKLRVPKPVSESPQILSILKAYQDQAANVFNLTNQTMVKNAKKIYVDVLNRSVANVVSGYQTPDQAIRRTIGMWADQGVPALIDKAGKKWGAEGYVRTVVNTTMHNTVNKAQDNRMDQWGVELVEVSSHAGARPLCAPYQGRIYKIQGSSPKYPNIYTDTSYGQPAGLFGINCGHFKYPFIEGVNTQTYFPYDEKENAEIYKQSQQQRAIERSIRQAKNKQEMYKAMGDEEGVKQATALIKQRQGAMREFINNTGRTRRRDREQIVKKVIPTEATPTVKFKPVKQKKSDIPNPADHDHIPQIPTPMKATTKEEPVMQTRPVVSKINTANFINVTDNSPDVKRDKMVFEKMNKKDVYYVNKYTSSYYNKMNGHLREDKGSSDTSLAKDVKSLQRVLKSNSQPLTEDTRFYRKFGNDALKYMFDEATMSLVDKVYYGNDSAAALENLKSKVIGGAIKDKAFVSSTFVQGSFGSGRDAGLDIYAPKGYTGGMYVNSISEFRSEKEYLFNSGMTFDIIDVKYKDGGITFEVVPRKPDAST